MHFFFLIKLETKREAGEGMILKLKTCHPEKNKINKIYIYIFLNKLMLYKRDKSLQVMLLLEK